MEREEIEIILQTAASFKNKTEVPPLQGMTVINLFLEPSTRTRASFELAAKRLSANIVNIARSESSLLKGETLLDTARNVEAMGADAIIIRHPASGAPYLVARAVQSAVINAGDGMHEHPSQGLLDIFTIKEKKGTLEGLKVAIVGDVLHSRVARSNIHGLLKMGAQVYLTGPPTLIPAEIERWGVSVHYRVEDAISGADVVMPLRLQTERRAGCFFPTLREYATLYGVNAKRLRLADPEALLMHPGPINRDIEVTSDVADGLSSAILEQATNGVAVRMALLYLLMS